MADPFVGEIRMFGGNFAPQGWALCNGQLLPISPNAALFSILGTTFGGDGVSTFALPDLRGRAPVNQGQGPGLSPYIPGQSIGTENVTMTPNQMPMHTHLVNASSAAAGRGGGNPSNNVPAVPTITGGPGNPAAEIYGPTPNATMNPNMIGKAGGNQPFSVIQPVLCVTFIIALNGIYPTRG